MKLTVSMLSQNADTLLTAAHGPLRVGWKPHHVADGASPNSSTVQRRKETAFWVVYPNTLYKKPYLSESFHLLLCLPLPLSVLSAEDSQTWQTSNPPANRPATGWWQHPSTTVYTTHCIPPSNAFYRN